MEHTDGVPPLRDPNEMDAIVAVLKGSEVWPGLLRGKPGHLRGCTFVPGLPLRGKPGHPARLNV